MPTLQVDVLFDLQKICLNRNKNQYNKKISFGL